MSMRESNLTDIGFFIDPVAAAYVKLSSDRKYDDVPTKIQKILDGGEFDKMAAGKTLPDDYCDVMTAQECLEYEKIPVVWAGGFTGNVESLIPEKTREMLDIGLSDAYVAYIPARKAPDLFYAAYGKPEDLMQEFKDKFGNAGIEFPEGFDFYARIASIKGVNYA